MSSEQFDELLQRSSVGAPAVRTLSELVDPEQVLAVTAQHRGSVAQSLLSPIERAMDVVVKSRHGTVSGAFRDYVEDKIARTEKLNDGRVIRVEVEVSAERDRRQHDQGSRVEITLRAKGPVVRVEAAAEDKSAAFDLALDKLMAHLRKAADRRRVHRGSRRPRSLQGTAADLPALPEELTAVKGSDVRTVAELEVQGEASMVVREKVHGAISMTLEQALHEMELVGHNLYLFLDVEHGEAPTVVYRRTAYDYGVIRLEADGPLAKVFARHAAVAQEGPVNVNE